jgi:ABC-2 type transport system permease protein
MRLRLRSTVSLAIGLVAVLLIVGALFPSVGDSFGKLDLPKGVTDLLGGADYTTITGWYRSEIASFYGPLVIAAAAVTGAVSVSAGEEEAGILALVLAQPVTRARLVIAKAGAVAIGVAAIALACWLGLIVGVALAGGGISTKNLGWYSLHLLLFGLAIGAFALAIGAGTGRKGLAAEVAAAVAVGGWLINGFAPLVDAFAWLRYLSPFYYYAHNDPLARGADGLDLAVLGVLTTTLTVLAVRGMKSRDLRA